MKGMANIWNILINTDDQAKWKNSNAKIPPNY